MKKLSKMLAVILAVLLLAPSVPGVRAASADQDNGQNAVTQSNAAV